MIISGLYYRQLDVTLNTELAKVKDVGIFFYHRMIRGLDVTLNVGACSFKNKVMKFLVR